MSRVLLTSDNYSKGFLIDGELMGGVTQNPDQPGSFVAFVLRHTTGEYLGYQPFPSLEQALTAINQVQREWNFENSSGCGGGNCDSGQCNAEKCGGSKPCGESGICPLG